MHRFTDALPAHVLPVSHVAFAAVAGGRGNAAAVQAQVGEMLAHIDRRLVQLAWVQTGKHHWVLSFGRLVEGKSWQLPLTDLNLLAAVASVAIYDGVLATVNVAATVSVLRGTFAVAADVQTAVAIVDDAAAVTGGKRKPLDAQSPVFICKWTIDAFTLYQLQGDGNILQFIQFLQFIQVANCSSIFLL